MAGTLTISTLSDGTNSTSSTNCIQGSAKAWVNFNGTTSPGTIRAAFNVSSVTKNSTGNYTVNLTTAMSDTNYAVCTGGEDQASSADRPLQGPSSRAVSTSTFIMTTGSDSTTNLDWYHVYAAIFR